MDTIFKVLGTGGLRIDPGVAKLGGFNFALLNSLSVQTAAPTGIYLTDGDVGITLSGTFNAFAHNDMPTQGSITSIQISFGDGTRDLLTISLDNPIPLKTFNAWRKAGDDAKLMEHILKGADHISGTEFDDHLNAGRGNDQIDGGAGNDRLEGEGGQDTLNGEDGDDFLLGGAGDDILDGGIGDDLFIGGAGADTINGGVGIDTVDYSREAQRVVVYLHQDRGTTTGAINDTLTSIEHVILGSGDDSFQGELGAVDETAWGGDGGDVLYGFAGDDTLYGESGADVLSGYGDDDVLDGGDGDDLLSGDDGNDILTGGAGSDRFEFWVYDDDDIITDFSLNDSIEFSDTSFQDFASMLAATTDVGSDCVITHAGGGLTVTLLGVSKADLRSWQFSYSTFAPALPDDKDAPPVSPALPDDGGLISDLHLLITSGGAPSTVDWLV